MAGIKLTSNNIPYLLIGGVMVACLLVSMVYFSEYFWIDDIINENYHRGLFSFEGFVSYDQLLFISNALTWFHAIFPGFPWYFFFLQSCLVGLYLLGITILFREFHSTTEIHKIMLVVFSLFFLEYLFLVGFSSVSILLSGISLVLLLKFHRNNSFWQNLFLFSFCSLGFLIRQNSSVVMILIVLFFFIVRDILEKERVLKKYLFPLGLVVFMLSSLSLRSLTRDIDTFRHQAWSSPYVFNLLDGFNYEYDLDNLSDKERAKFKALAHWYYLDEAEFTKEYFESIGGANPFRWLDAQQIKKNILDEWDKLNTRTEVSLGKVKQVHIFVFYSVVLLSIMACFFWKMTRNRRASGSLVAGITTVLFTFLLFIVGTVFIKFETRIFAPVSFVLIFLLFFLIVELDFTKTGKRVFIALIIVGTLLRMGGLLNSINVKRVEAKEKSSFIEDFSNQKEANIVLLDLYSMSLFGSNPYHFKPEFNFILTTFGEHPYHLIEDHKEYLNREICAYESFPDFFDCTLVRNDVLWIMPDFKTKILEDYYLMVYGRRYVFEPTSNQYSLDEVGSSFLWGNVNFGVYKLNLY